MLRKVKELLSASAIYGLGNVASKFIGFFLLPIFTRFLTPAEYGLFETYNVLLYLMTTLALLGIDAALSRFYYDHPENSERRRQIVTTTFLISCSLGVVLCLVGIVGSRQINDILFARHGSVTILRLTFSVVTLSIVNSLLLALFQTKRQPIRYSVFTILRFVLIYALSVFFLIQGKGVWGIILSHLVAYSLIAVVGIWVTRGDFAPSISFALIPSMMKFSIPIAFASVSIWVLSSADRFFLARFATLQDVGIYSIASRIASIVGIAVMAFQMAWPQFVFALSGQAGDRYTFSRMLTYYLFVSLILVLGVTLFTPGLLYVLATPSYREASSVVFLLSCASLLYGLYFIFGITLTVTKRTGAFFPVTIIPMVVSLGLNYVLVPRFGVTGAATTSVLTYALMAVMMYATTQHFNPMKYEWGRILKMSLLAAGVLLASIFVHSSSFAINLLLKISLLSGYVLGLISVGFFYENEKIVLMKVLRRVLLPYSRSPHR